MLNTQSQEQYSILHYSKALNAPLQTNTLQAQVGFYPSNMFERWTRWTPGSFENGEVVEVKDPVVNNNR